MQQESPAKQIPEEVRARYDTRDAALVWDLDERGSVWRLDLSNEPTFVKVKELGARHTLREEAERMEWLQPYVTVPRVVELDSNEHVEWLIATAIEGSDATKRKHVDEPEKLLASHAAGLRAFHESVPVDGCPFDYRMKRALDQIRQHAHEYPGDAQFKVEGEELGITTESLSFDEAMRELESNIPDEDLVVCHGDYCFPNVMFDSETEVTGYIDLGSVGIADRWWDLAIGTWSTTWNLGPGWERTLLDGYGIAPDKDRIRYYRLLYSVA